MRTLLFSLALCLTVPAFAQDETPMAAPVELPDATAQIVFLHKQIALRDVVIAEQRAQLAALNAVCYRALAESDSELLKNFTRYLIALLENRGKKK